MLEFETYYELSVKIIHNDASNLVPDLSISAEVEINSWLIGLGFGVMF